jgi:LPS export ABC transporter protein LptC
MKPTPKQIKGVLLAVITLTVGALVWAYVDHRQGADRPRAVVENLDTDADMQLGKVHQTATRDGEKEWDLVAGSAKYSDDKSEVEFEDLAATFFLEDNQEVSLNADRGVLQTDSRDMAVSGNVVVENRGYRLETESLTYNHEKRIILSQAPVVISGQAFRFAADRMFLDLETQEAELEGKVKGSFDEDFTL